MERNSSALKNHELSLRGKRAIVVALSSAAAVGIGFDQLSKSDEASSITCEGAQDVSVEAGQTYSGIIDQYVETTGVRAGELPNLVGGIAANQPADFDGVAYQITAGDYSEFANKTQVQAGGEVTVPVTCEVDAS